MEETIFLKQCCHMSEASDNCKIGDISAVDGKGIGYIVQMFIFKAYWNVKKGPFVSLSQRFLL